MGLVRGAWGSWYGSGGYVSQTGFAKTVVELKYVPDQSILKNHITQDMVHHEDTFMISLKGVDFKGIGAKDLLELLLEGFLLNAPRSVSRLMMFRNMLVKPLGLRTSPLGCPVSSLLSGDMSNLFANKYPVLDQKTEDDGAISQVILGADDRHLRFRSCVGVEVIDQYHAKITLGTRVHCKNLFGRFYMFIIDYVHRHYITPTMLRRAADYVISKVA
jgi:hypothetical protein